MRWGFVVLAFHVEHVMTPPTKKPQKRPAREREPKTSPTTPDQARRELGFNMLRDERKR